MSADAGGTEGVHSFVAFLLLMASQDILYDCAIYFTHVLDEIESLLSHVHPDNALSPQLRVNRGELSPKSFIVDHILDSLAQLFSSHNLISHQDILDPKFALVAFGRATSAKL